MDAEALFAAGDVDGDGSIGLQDAAAFFAGALIPVAAMNTIWGAAVPDGRAIHKETFPTVLLLIAAAQRGVVPLTVATAVAAAPLPPPRFIALSEDDKRKYAAAFQQATSTLVGQLAPGQVVAMPPATAAQVFMPWRLQAPTLNAIWRLADRDRDNALSLPEFCIAMALVVHAAKGGVLPNVVPATLLYKLPAPMCAPPAQQQKEQAQEAVAPKSALTESQQRQAAAKMENELAVERKTAKYLEESTAKELKKESQLKEQLAKLTSEKQKIQQQIEEAQQQQESRKKTTQACAEEQSRLGAQLMQLEQQVAEQDASVKAQEAAVEKAKSHEAALEKVRDQLQTELESTQKERAEHKRVCKDDAVAWVASIRGTKTAEPEEQQHTREAAQENILEVFCSEIAQQRSVVMLDDPLLC